MEFEDEVDLLMSGDIISAQVSTKPISFNKAKAGWIFREDSEFNRANVVPPVTLERPLAGEEMVGNYRATFYNVNGINLETRKRREHLSDADLQKNKQLLESFTKGNMEQGGGIGTDGSPVKSTPNNNRNQMSIRILSALYFPARNKQLGDCKN